MNELSNLANAGLAGIAIAILITVLLIVKWLIPVLKETFGNLNKSIEKNTEVTHQMSEWLKNRNGILEKKLDKLNKKK